ncbi:SRPBCC domain-containing protein [Roseomonas hellenica]|uniref:SRPBCC domain-containing protein n=1 Tax=Plastoroseomonas hellenica TaxID=2687306 RepID=A0ABS5EYQ2_9PROT|nr:SRPBCC domain-containing protein [Plastoroseomonas hellenica]MBR0665425.1 SRPBCC domain-containing protein [Plastoroseomonas hellenica]
MPVKKEPSGRRSVQAETEVPGSPEQVWQAIASGPGISSWFVPTRLDGRVGGTTASEFGPGMESAATIMAWEPPMRFVAESEGGPGPGKVATEWTVEAKAGGTCTVRVVHSWFASTDDWDDQFEGHSHGWLSFFQILRLYLQHFDGEPSALVQLLAMSAEAQEKAWDALVRPLGLAAAKTGETVTTSAGPPALRGVVEVVNPPQWPGLILRLDQPAPAIAHLFTMPMAGQVLLSVRFYLYGAAADRAEDIRHAWQDWLDHAFPPAGPAPDPT